MNQCNVCGKSFRDAFNFKRHQQLMLCDVKCGKCNKFIPRSMYTGHVLSANHKLNCNDRINKYVEIIDCAFRNRLLSCRIKNIFGTTDTAEFKSHVSPIIKDLLTDYMKQHISLKFNVELFGSFSIPAKNQHEEKSFNTKMEELTLGSDLDDILTNMFEIIRVKMEEFEEKDSGWAIDTIDYIQININKYNPLRASSFIKLPKFIERKKCVVNVKNDDNLCFAWSIIAALRNINENCKATELGDISSSINTSGLDFPMKLIDVKKFEKQNPEISVNVFGLKQHSIDKIEVIGPYCHTKEKKLHHVNLLMITNKYNTKSHYCWIRDLPKLVKDQYHNRHSKPLICDGCLCFFENNKKLEDHQREDCTKIKVQIPMAGEKIEFMNYRNKFKVNISNTWTLPQEGFSVFYRFFRDKISWFEADAVCQFHHANLVTVSNGIEFDATRAFLKELDVTEPVWIGLMRPQNSVRFSWTNSKLLDTTSGYWAESIPVVENPLCGAIDPVRDFRWHALRCGGPETAAFLCEMNVPDWATDCTINAMPSLTIQYMSDSGTIQLSRDCGEEGTRHMMCKGKQDRDIILKELICTDDNIGVTDITFNEVTSTTTEANIKIISQILSVPAENNEDNQIEMNANAIENVPQEKVLDKYNFEDMMISDAPADKEILKKAQQNKKIDLADGKKKLFKNAEKKNKQIDGEMMMGDQPIQQKEDFLLHQKKIIVNELKLKPTPRMISSTQANFASVDTSTSQSKIVPQSTIFVPLVITSQTDSEALSSTYITSTTTMIATTQDQRARRGTETEPSMMSTELTTIEPSHSETLSTSTDTKTDDSTIGPYELTSIPTDTIHINFTPVIPSTTLKPDPNDKGSGHPVHIPKNILIRNDNPTPSTPQKHATIQMPRTTIRRDFSEEHFIPPMLLVKAQFSSTKQHTESTTLKVPSSILKVSTTVAAQTEQSSMAIETTSDVIVDEKSYSVVENGTVIDVLDLTEKATILSTQNIHEDKLLLTSTPPKLTTINGIAPEITTEISVNISTLINGVTNLTTQPTEMNAKVLTSIPIPNLTITNVSIETTVPPQKGLDITKPSVQQTNFPVSTTATISTVNHSIPEVDMLSPSRNNINSVISENSSEEDLNQDHQDDHHHHHEHHDYTDNKFSNIDYQPYKPNRHRTLSKPDSPSMIKKILGRK